MSIDLGTGDGRAVLNAARGDASRLFIGIDASLDGLVTASTAAARKPARGGVRNAWFVHASADALPPELAAAADRISVLLPWNSLLEAVLAPDIDVLRGIAALAVPGATMEIVVSLDERDGRALETPSRERLAAPYRAAGWQLRGVTPLETRELAEVGTTWAKRLAHGRPRSAWRLLTTNVGGQEGLHGR